MPVMLVAIPAPSPETASNAAGSVLSMLTLRGNRPDKNDDLQTSKQAGRQARMLECVSA